MPTLKHICRHPVKSLGEEALDRIAVTAGAHLPWDRRWAIAHGRSEHDFEAEEYVRSRSYVIQTTTPALSQTQISFDERSGILGLSHPVLGELNVNPVTESDRLTDWIAPIADPAGPPPYRLAERRGAGMTDFPDTHISIGSLSSLRALEQMAGCKLDLIRFRMNFWVDGFAPWEELDWIDDEITVGGVQLKVLDPVKRCTATHANPATGTTDIAVTRLLYDRFQHMNFGIYATALTSGEVNVGDEVIAS
ncbi:MAG: MOSC domain-containing protein [Pikeienuella sp.]